MKTYIKLIGASMLVISLGAIISSCKSPGIVDNVEETTEAEDAPKDTSAAVVDDKRQPLKISIKGLPSGDAPVVIAFYGTKSSFPDPKGKLKAYKFTPKDNVLTAEIKDLEFGTYAFALYQDENKNGKFDKNKLGVPKEAYALSNNYKPKLKPPKFSQCQFEYTASTRMMTINMID